MAVSVDLATGRLGHAPMLPAGMGENVMGPVQFTHTFMHRTPADRGSLAGAKRGRAWAMLLTLMTLGTVLAGCKVTNEDVQYWKGTVKGPRKIVAVLKATRYPIELRTQAALALVEMERRDVDGVAQLQQAIQAVRGRDEAEAQQLVDGMVPRLGELMSGADNAQAHEADEGPSELSTRAKDAAYMLIPFASDAHRGEMIDAVVGWYVAGFSRRALAGNYSAEQVVRSLGARAASILVDALNSHMPKEALVKIAEMIGQQGDDATKARAAERLVAIEQEIEGDEFFDWLKTQIRTQIQQRSGADEVNENRVLAVATLNREKFINEGALPAMKHLAAQETVRTRLLTIAQTAPASGAAPAVALMINQRRTNALKALEGNAVEAQLPQFLAIALDDGNPSSVRDYAFDRIGDIRSAAAIPRLWPLVQNADNDTNKKRLRWRGGELVLAIGGNGIVGQFLTKLPTDREVAYEPEELEGYATRMSQMTQPPTALMRRQLRSSNWFARIIALRFLQRRGTEADKRAMQRLVRDSAATVGEAWARLHQETVGKVAEDAIHQLEERLAQPAPAAGADAGTTAPDGGTATGSN